MAAFYMTLKIIAFIAVLILPFKGPKKRKVTSQGGISESRDKREWLYGILYRQIKRS